MQLGTSGTELLFLVTGMSFINHVIPQHLFLMRNVIYRKSLQIPKDQITNLEN